MCTMAALILSKRKHNSSSTVYFFVQIALTGKPTLSVGGAKASDRLSSSCQQHRALLTGLYQRLRAFGRLDPGTQTASVCVSLESSFLPQQCSQGPLLCGGGPFSPAPSACWTLPHA